MSAISAIGLLQICMLGGLFLLGCSLVLIGVIGNIVESHRSRGIYDKKLSPFPVTVTYEFRCMRCDVVEKITFRRLRGSCIELPSVPEGWMEHPLLCPKHYVEISIDDEKSTFYN